MGAPGGGGPGLQDGRGAGGAAPGTGGVRPLEKPPPPIATSPRWGGRAAGLGAAAGGPGGDAAPLSPQESGDDEYRGDQSDSDDEVDSDFDIDEGEEPASDQDESEPKRRRRVVTKAYRVRVGVWGPLPGSAGKGWAPWWEKPRFKRGQSHGRWEFFSLLTSSAPSHRSPSRAFAPRSRRSPAVAPRRHER